ncbi:MAG: alpha-mannosidase [Calditrichaeota bacterium]|nr:alpha-mannosidase [Calditrichota bacterium]MBT7789424.1 alpha-mannosidase [Calditrichota bacterium]
MPDKKLFLVCNAHLDPVWLWEWEEGLAETISTFRTAAEFCDESDGFVFCHNESLLYQWIEEYEPKLFGKIRSQIGRGRWHIMGGWYLQPDCNVLSGESFVRQILVGKQYFIDKFNREPRTAVNLDPFGHSRGIVQILKKSGYTSYLFCRPDEKFFHLEGSDFKWIGYDGSELLTHRADEHYNSSKGKARGRIEKWIDDNPNTQTGILLWGIGNHGGGPSRVDLNQINEIKKSSSNIDISHGTPEEYFEWLANNSDNLPEISKSLNPWAVGCYTSMAGVKQKHREIENRYLMTEKMLTHAAMQGLIEYPGAELRTALEDMLFCEFHDILPGSAIPEVESYAVQRLDHGLEILSRLKAKAFFKLLSGQPKASEGEFPICVYNPHPYDIEETVTVEFQPAEPNFNSDVFMYPELRDCNGNLITTQLEKESSNIADDNRKRIAFRTTLKAASMNRFSCYLKPGNLPEEKPAPEDTTHFEFKNENCEISISRDTGLIDLYQVDGVDILGEMSFNPLVIKDYADPWGMKVRSFRNVKGTFTLMNVRDSATFAGLTIPRLEPVHIIEDGPVRTIVEALFKYNHSSLCIRYIIPKSGSEIEINLKVYWLEKDKMLKLSIPTLLKNSNCRGQVAYGVEEFDREGEELVAQKWVSVVSEDQNQSFTVINDCIHGLDFESGELRLSLLRSPAYSGHPVKRNLHITPQDRFEPRMDQGERNFRFWLNAGTVSDRLARIDREALVRNEPPMNLCCFPSGDGETTVPAVVLSDHVVQLNALKIAEKNNWLILRLFEPTGHDRKTSVQIPHLGMEFEVSLGGYEIKTIGIDPTGKTYFELDLLERRID